MTQTHQNENAFQYLERMEMYAADATIQTEKNSDSEPLDLIMNLLDTFLLHASE
ncbi:MAG: hypothetical protein ACW976_01745 [Candidatus Ranarchaeia archaeon]|jgi:hypothetical protein